MNRLAPELVVFDLAGTTIRDRGEVPGAFIEALKASGMTIEAAEVSALRGASKREAVGRLVAGHRPALEPAAREELARSTYEQFRRELTRRLRASHDLAMPESQSVFERLHRAGIRVALNTGFDRAVVDVTLEVVGWPDDVIDAIVCGDEVAEGRPSPQMILRAMALTGVTDSSRVAVVGDTRLDLEAGANARAAYRIGVLSGAHDRATLEAAPHTHVLASIADVPGLWGA
jgi:phosphonatase-like hydrolase